MSTLYVDSLQPNLGSGVHISGHVLQTVFVNDSSEFSNNTTSFTDTNLTATITPQSTSSKILVTTNLAVDIPIGTVMSARLLRGTSVIKTEGYWGFINAQNTGDYHVARETHYYLDTSATTSPITYKWQLARASGTVLPHYLSYDDANHQTDSQFILQEIAQ